jgi:hypothetical protein
MPASKGRLKRKSRQSTGENQSLKKIEEVHHWRDNFNKLHSPISFNTIQ